MNVEKRRFQRIPFDAIAMIGTEPAISGMLQDISLKGALIALSKGDKMPSKDSFCVVTIKPNQSDFSIQLDTQVAYVNPDTHTFGVNITKLELDSATHLRRLIEINLGDEMALQRELNNLISTLEN